MLRAVALAGLLCVSGVQALTGAALEAEFASWMTQHSKAYATEAERLARMQTYAENLKRIEELNRSHNGRAQFKVNKFADLSVKEFKDQWASGLKGADLEAIRAGLPEWDLPKTTANLPTSWDWATKGAVTPVKNQGQCGSCWSFSTTGNIEGLRVIQKNQSLVGLSEQQLVDCSTAEGNMGCNGGLMSDAFKYILKSGGLESEAAYPYTATGPDPCQFDKSKIVKDSNIVSWKMISSGPGGAAAMQQATYRNPISIAADAASWQFYFTGVVYWPGCGTSLDHGILITGWGEETDIFGQKMPYWIVKNSWGADWGKDGYLWVERGDNECGVQQFACSADMLA